MNDTREMLDDWNRKWRTLLYWSQFYIGFKTAQARGNFLSEEKKNKFWEERHSYLAEKLWLNIAELRGWWVKVGQFLSTRSDILPEQYLQYLEKLQDAMPTSDFKIIKTIVENELGKEMDDVFISFETDAIASASIGQVHKAQLKSTGEYVIVKVQHPGVDKTLKQDMITLTQMTWAFGVLEKGFDLSDVLNEWQKSAADELDFRKEAYNTERAREALLKSGINMVIPKIYKEYTTQKMLVMEYCEGFKITDSEKIKNYNINMHNIIEDIIHFFAYQIHIDGMFHGDPHPGNILIQIDQSTGQVKAVLLDWGLVKFFNDVERIAFSKALYSASMMDALGLIDALEDMGFKFKSDSFTDPEHYIDMLRSIFDTDVNSLKTFSTKQVISSAKKCNFSKQNIMRKNPIDEWPKSIIFFMRVASLIHGICLQLNIKVPFFQILVDRAYQCLIERYIPTSLNVYTKYPHDFESKNFNCFEWKIHKFITSLKNRSECSSGYQVAVFQNNYLIADVAVGQMGPVNTRPVQKDSLFSIMTLSHGLVVTAILKLINDEKLGIKDPICYWWDGFIKYGKETITVEDVLSHSAGLYKTFPINLTLSEFIDYDSMISIFEDISSDDINSTKKNKYAFLVSSWILSEVIYGVTGLKVNEFFEREFINPLCLSNEFFYPVSNSIVANSKKKKKNSKYRPISSYQSTFYDNSLCSLKKNRENSVSLEENQYDLSNNETLNNGQKYTTWLQSSRLNIFDNIEFTDTPITMNPTITINKQQCSDNISSESPPVKKIIDENNLFFTSNNPINMRKLNNQFLHCKNDNYANKKRDSNKHGSRYFESFFLPTNKTGKINPILRFTSLFRNIRINQLLSYSNPRKNAKFSDSNSYYEEHSNAKTLFPSKNIQKIHQYIALDFKCSKRTFISVFEFARLKPQVLDPLIYDSTKLHSCVIPPTNCRATARALCKFYAHVFNGKVLNHNILKKVKEIRIIDNSIDTSILSGFSSRFFGLGFQLYPCITARYNQALKPELNLNNVEHSSILTNSAYLKIHSTQYKLSSKKFESNKWPHNISNVALGIGNSDLGGNISVSFPELRLNIVILANNILSGPATSNKILEFILETFLLHPAWNIPSLAKESIEVNFDNTYHSNKSIDSSIISILSKEKELVTVSLESHI